MISESGYLVKPRLSLFIFKNFLTYFWSIVDLQCFRCTAKWISYLLHVDSVSIQIITGYWVGLPVLYSGCYLVIYFIYSGVYMSVPISQFLPPFPFHLHNHKFVSMSVTISFYSEFICTFFFDSTYKWYWTFQVVLVVKNLPANAGDIRDVGSIPQLGRSPEGRCGNPLQYSCL